MIAKFRQNMPAIFEINPDTRHDLSDRIIRAEVLREQLFSTPDVISGTLRLQRAEIVGPLDLRGVTVPVALFLEECDVTQPIVLADAEIPRLNLRSSRVAGLNADGLVVKKSLNAQEARFSRAVYLRGASVGGELNLVAAHFELDGEFKLDPETALHADGLQVDGDLLLSKGFTAKSDGDGVVRLLGARIGGDLIGDGARIENSRGGPALHAERISVGGNVFLRRAWLSGTAVLLGATVQGRLIGEHATLHGQHRPALMADGLRAEGDVALTGLTASGDGARAVICLRGARTGALVCDPGDEADALGVTAGGVALDLMLAKVGSQLTLDSRFCPRGRILLDGLEYPAVPQGMDRRGWVGFLRDRVEYATQPYQRLAGAYRAAGEEEDARAVLIAQRDHLLRRPGLPWYERIRLRLLKVTLGYGYQSWRALVGLALTLVAAVIFALVAGPSSHALRVPQTSKSCAVVDRVGLGVQLAVPFLSTTNRSRCDMVTARTRDAWVAPLSWLFQIFGWIFATLFVAGFSGLIRKS